MQFSNKIFGILSSLSFVLLYIPIINIFPFSKVEPSERRISSFLSKMEFNKLRTSVEALLIPCNSMIFFGCSSVDLINLHNSVSSLLIFVLPEPNFSNIFLNSKSSTFVDFKIRILIISKPNFFDI